MVGQNLVSVERENRAAASAVLLIALLLAFAAARNWTSWNDLSRLATVESLVDYHTLAIDHSSYLHGCGGDKLYVQGHYYSDKSPVPALLMAVLYQGLQASIGLVAREQPAAFAYCMTVASCGLAYVLAVWCVFRLTGVLHLPLPTRLALTDSFGLSTVALAYSRQVNAHVQLLAVGAALFLVLARLASAGRAGLQSWPRLLSVGGLAGLGYTIDLGAGPVLFGCTFLWVACRCRNRACLTAFVLAALPWLALHHSINYAVGGTFKPANAVPEYLNWPGYPLKLEEMTGVWNHPSVGHFLLYAGEFLVGGRGFLSHNLPLFLAVPGLLVLLWRRVPETPELLLAGFWSGGAWLAYALTSTNYSGLCVSVRWLVPLLAPGFFVLAVLLRHFPQRLAAFLVLSAWGAVLAGFAWSCGTWYRQEVRFFWPIQTGALLSWLAWELRSWMRAGGRRRYEREVALLLPLAGEEGRRSVA